MILTLSSIFLCCSHSRNWSCHRCCHHCRRCQSCLSIIPPNSFSSSCLKINFSWQETTSPTKSSLGSGDPVVLPVLARLLLHMSYTSLTAGGIFGLPVGSVVWASSNAQVSLWYTDICVAHVVLCMNLLPLIHIDGENIINNLKKRQLLLHFPCTSVHGHDCSWWKMEGEVTKRGRDMRASEIGAPVM